MTPVQRVLVDAWALQQRGDVYKNYKRLNPGEALKLETYWANGGHVPVLASRTGRALTLFAKARWT